MGVELSTVRRIALTMSQGRPRSALNTSEFKPLATAQR